jgi:3-phosphoglycerate kinase
MKKRFRLTEFPINGKIVLLRTDFNVPLKKKGKTFIVADNTKIKASLPTIRYLLKHDCRIIILSHLGRPQGKKVSSCSLKPVENELFKLLRVQKHKKIILLENLRFHPGEDTNDRVFAQHLAQLSEVYVNDAFGVSHRTNASTIAITEFLPSVSGLLMDNEIENLSLALQPKRPSVWIIGGAKLDKIDLFTAALNKANSILVGGALAFSFLKAKGYTIGMSAIDAQSVRNAKKFLKRARRKLILPIDVIVADSFRKNAKKNVVPVTAIPDDWAGLDIGPRSVSLFKKHLRSARTIVWNGPMGVFEWPQFADGTRNIAEALAKSHAITIVGGGETAEAVKKFTVEKKLTHVSTGGGASLAFLSGKTLPAIQALERNYKKFRKMI